MYTATHLGLLKYRGAMGGSTFPTRVSRARGLSGGGGQTTYNRFKLPAYLDRYIGTQICTWADISNDVERSMLTQQSRPFCTSRQIMRVLGVFACAP